MPGEGPEEESAYGEVGEEVVLMDMAGECESSVGRRTW